MLPNERKIYVDGYNFCDHYKPCNEEVLVHTPKLDKDKVPVSVLEVKTKKPLEDFKVFSVRDFSIECEMVTGQILNLVPVKFSAGHDANMDNVEKALDLLDDIEKTNVEPQTPTE